MEYAILTMPGFLALIVLLILIMRGAVLNQRPPIDVKVTVRPDVVDSAGETSNRTVLAAGLLGLFLGGLGIHDFYLGYKGSGGIHIGLVGASILLIIIGTTVTILGGLSAIIPGMIISVLAYIVMIGNSLWGAIVGIIILTRPKSGRYAFDADGRVLQ